MAHFAEIDEKGIVKRVIVAEQEFIDSGLVGDPKNWIQTSYNTRKGLHTKGGIPMRKNYAGIGYIYDKERDAFIAPKPFPSWSLDENSCDWTPPIPEPRDKAAKWNEKTQEWVEKI